MRPRMGPTRRAGPGVRPGLALLPLLLGLLCLAAPLGAVQTEAGKRALITAPLPQTPPHKPTRRHDQLPQKQGQHQQERQQQQEQGKAAGALKGTEGSQPVFEYREDFPQASGSPQETTTSTPHQQQTPQTQGASVLLQVQKRLRGPWLAFLSALPLHPQPQAPHHPASPALNPASSQPQSAPLTAPLVFDYTEDFPSDLPSDLLDGSELAFSSSSSSGALPGSEPSPSTSPLALLASARQSLQGQWRELLAQGLYTSLGVPRETPEDAPLDAEGDALPLGEAEGEGRAQRAQSLLRIAQAAAQEAGMEGEFPLVFDYSEDFNSGAGEGEDVLGGAPAARRTQPQAQGQGQGMGLGFLFPQRGAGARRLLADVRGAEKEGASPLVFDHTEGFPTAEPAEGSSVGASKKFFDSIDLTVFDNTEGFPVMDSAAQGSSAGGEPAARGRGSQGAVSSSPLKLQQALSEALKPALEQVAAFVTAGSEDLRRTLGVLKDALEGRLGPGDALRQTYVEDGESDVAGDARPGSMGVDEGLQDRLGSEYIDEDGAEPDLATLLDPTRVGSNGAPEDEDDYFPLPFLLSHKSQLTGDKSQVTGGTSQASSVPMESILRQVALMRDSDRVTGAFENAGGGFPEEVNPTATDSDTVTDTGVASVFENAGEGFPEDGQGDGEGRSSDYVPTEEQGDMPVEVLQLPLAHAADSLPLVKGTQDGVSTRHLEALAKALTAGEGESLGLPEAYSSQMASDLATDGTQDWVSSRHLEGRKKAEKARVHKGQTLTPKPKAQGTPQYNVFVSFAEDFPESLEDGRAGEREGQAGERKGDLDSRAVVRESPDIFDNAEDFPGELPEAQTGRKRMSGASFLSGHREATI